MAGRGSKPGERRGGRQAGTPNKITRSVKEAFEAAFREAQELDGVKLSDWMRINPDDFYKICAKLIPTDIKASVTATVKAPGLEVVAAALGVSQSAIAPAKTGGHTPREEE